VRFGISLVSKSMYSKKDTFHGEWTALFFHDRNLKKSVTFWLSELEVARNTWCLYRKTFKDKLVKSISEIQSLIHLIQSENHTIRKTQAKPEKQ
jgi:hypothetical protein